jgi:hypothetical protein
LPEPSGFYFTSIAMSIRLLIATVALVVLTHGPGHAEIVERELGTDGAGNAISGHVFQGGRNFRRPARVSGLPARRIERVHRWHDWNGLGTPWWFVPVIPMHCGGHAHGGSLTLWHGWGDRVSVTIIR